MTTIVYIPLDERPVNLVFPQILAEPNQDTKLITPPLHLLGVKKQAAPLDELWSWLEDQLPEAHYLLASLDMLVYGGIVPSRLHTKSVDECQTRLNRLAALKKMHPDLKIFAFNLIMRVPAYNSADEEPEYYQHYGQQIFRWGWLEDKFGRGQGTEEDQEEWDTIKSSIPEEIKTDYLRRRGGNHLVNAKAIELTAQGAIDFLVIPLDDCAEYGFSAAEQSLLLKKIEQGVLHHLVHVYPGADEVGSTLLCRIVNEVKNHKPRIYVRYSSTIGPQIIPRYEDRPLGESIKSQITVCGGIIVDNSLEADLVLMVNSPTLNYGKMQEATSALQNKDTSYYSFRNLREFVESIAYYSSLGRKTALADVAFGNGADHELMQMLRTRGLLGQLHSYAGWNTPGNTIGTVLAHALINQDQRKHPDKFTLDRFVEDWGYQVLVRAQLRDHSEELGITYFDLKDHQPHIAAIAHEKLQAFLKTELGAFKDVYTLESVYFPWNRLFEIGLNSRLR